MRLQIVVRERPVVQHVYTWDDPGSRLLHAPAAQPASHSRTHEGRVLYPLVLCALLFPRLSSSGGTGTTLF